MALTRPEPCYLLDDPEEVDTPDDEETRCRLCKIKGKEETPIHVVQECLAVWRSRWNYLGHYTLEGEEHIKWDPNSLVGFLRELDLENQPN